MDRGYIKLWRKSIDSGWLQNHKLWVFWTWCLLKASHKEHVQIVGFQHVNLMPGEFIFGIRKASEELRISVRSLRTILNFLKTGQKLTLKPTHKFSVISIMNWDNYQQLTPPTDTLNDMLPTHCRHTADHKQEWKECKEVINKETTKGKKAPETPLPETVKKEIWVAFLEMRKTIKKPATPYAQKLIIKKLERLGGDPNRLLEQSIENSWQDIYALKTERGNGNGRKTYNENQRDVGFASVQARADEEVAAIVAEYERNKTLRKTTSNTPTGDTEPDHKYNPQQWGV